MSCISNSNKHSDEPIDSVTPAQQFKFGHHIGKRTIRFTLFDWVRI